jgi:hypothetical protein
MPPQPLSSKHLSGGVAIHPLALRRHPELASRVGEIIAIWARIEAGLATILGRMLGSHARPSRAMYATIHNSQRQEAVLEAAAKDSLSKENRELFDLLMVAVKCADATHYKVAHWLWGDSPDFPDSLILVDPSALVEYDKTMSDFLAAVERGAAAEIPPALDFSRSFVWEDQHFSEAIDEMNDVYFLIRRFASLLLTKPGADAGLRSQLLNSPRIQQVLRQKGGLNSDVS